MGAPLSFSSNASSAARAEQNNTRGNSGVIFNKGGTVTQMLPLLAVLALVAFYIARKRG